MAAERAGEAATYDYAGKNFTTGQQSNSWNIAASWTNGPHAFPNATADVARTVAYVDGSVSLYLNQDINLGTLDWSGRTLQVCPGNPPGKLIVANAGLSATWPVYTLVWFWLDTDLVLNESLTLSNVVDCWDTTHEAARLNGLISGPGRLTLHWYGFTNYPLCIGVLGSPAPNTHSGGTRLEGHMPNGGYFEPRKNGAFGTGDIELNGYAKLVLRDRGPVDDYVADSASLRLETINVTNRARVYLAGGVNEVIRKLFLDGVEQPAGDYGASGSGATQTLNEFFEGPGIIIVTSGPPSPGTLQNLPPSNITSATAILAGNLLGTNASPTSVKIFWGLADGGRRPGAWQHEVSLNAVGPGGFSVPTSNRPAGETVYYRCYLTNTLGAKWADGSMSFGPPKVQNLLPLVRTNRVTLRATVLSTNGLPTQAMVFWGPIDGGTGMANWQNCIGVGAVSEGPLTTNISGPLPNTRYYYRSCLSNAADTAWANTSMAFTMLAPPALGDITFLATSDLHYGCMPFRGNTTDQLSRKTLDNMNALAGQLYPASLGGGPIGLPRGALLPGDVTESGTASQWMSFTNDWGLNGDRQFPFPVFEGFGNHDYTSFVMEAIKARNPGRTGVVNISTNGYHYSWDWDFLHVVCLNLFPGDDIGGYGCDPKRSLQFLVDDLATRVGASRRPVVLYHHYGFEPISSSYWNSQQQTNYFEAIRNYNIVGILAGHNHAVTFINWSGIDTFNDGTAGEWYGNFIVAHVTCSNLNLLERTTSNTWGRSFSKIIWVPGTLAVSNDEGATKVSLHSAHLNGHLLTPNPPPVSVAVYWGPIDGGTNETYWANALRWDEQKLGEFHAEVSNLTENTTYYYRCSASNASGKVWATASAKFKTPSDFSGWHARMKCSFSAYNSRETLTNFPALIVLSTNRAGFAYDQFASDVGNDLRFSDENGLELNYEIDEWNTNGSSYVWVQVPRLEHTNMALWAYWKNIAMAAVPPAYTTNGATWSEGYMGVWHMKQTDTVNSVNGNVSVAHGNLSTNGLVGVAQSFSRAATNQYIEVGDLDVTNLTIEAWTRSTYANPPGNRRVIEKAGAFRWEQTDGDNNLKLVIFNAGLEYDFEQHGCVEFAEPAWNYEAISYDAATSEAKGYMNGNPRYAQSKSACLIPAQNSAPTTLSSRVSGYYGRLEEIRLSGVVRSADWLGACYDTVTNHESFTRYDPVLLNTPPVFQPIPDQTISAGDTLRITNVVTDAESPPQILTFNLISAPSGASLDASRGVFSWTPGYSEICTTNVVNMKVTDNGIPPRCATQSLQIIVGPPMRPMHGAVGWSNGQWTMVTWGFAGRDHLIQFSTNLQDWVSINVTNPSVTPFLWTDPNSGTFGTRFYRVFIPQ